MKMRMKMGNYITYFYNYDDVDPVRLQYLDNTIVNIGNVGNNFDSMKYLSQFLYELQEFYRPSYFILTFNNHQHFYDAFPQTYLMENFINKNSDRSIKVFVITTDDIITIYEKYWRK